MVVCFSFQDGGAAICRILFCIKFRLAGIENVYTMIYALRFPPNKSSPVYPVPSSIPVDAITPLILNCSGLPP